MATLKTYFPKVTMTEGQMNIWLRLRRAKQTTLPAKAVVNSMMSMPITHLGSFEWGGDFVGTYFTSCGKMSRYATLLIWQSTGQVAAILGGAVDAQAARQQLRCGAIDLIAADSEVGPNLDAETLATYKPTAHFLRRCFERFGVQADFVETWLRGLPLTYVVACNHPHRKEFHAGDITVIADVAERTLITAYLKTDDEPKSKAVEVLDALSNVEEREQLGQDLILQSVAIASLLNDGDVPENLSVLQKLRQEVAALNRYRVALHVIWEENVGLS